MWLEAKGRYVFEKLIWVWSSVLKGDGWREGCDFQKIHEDMALRRWYREAILFLVRLFKMQK